MKMAFKLQCFLNKTKEMLVLNDVCNVETTVFRVLQNVCFTIAN